MKKYLFLLLPLLMAFRPGTFEPESFFWSTPTQYVDGTALPPENILAFLLDCSSDKGGSFHAVTPGNTTVRFDVPLNTFNAGTWQCTIRTRASLDSDPSLPVEFVVANFTFIVAPMPPSGLGVG